MARNAHSPLAQPNETRWMVFIDQEGKLGYRWWLWALLGVDTVAFRLDPTRSHEVPQRHYAHDARLILMVDHYSAYKTMAQVKTGNIVLAYYWAHVRRDIVEVGKGWSALQPWAIDWLRRIRDLYRAQRRCLEHQAGSPDFQRGDADVRRIGDEMWSQAVAELDNPKLRAPCRKALDSLRNHWVGLTRFVDDLRIPLDNNRSERAQRNPAVDRKNYYGSGALWSGNLAAMLFSIFATLELWSLNPREWLTRYLQGCAENGGRAPADVTPFLPWNISANTSIANPLAPSGSS